MGLGLSAFNYLFRAHAVRRGQLGVYVYCLPPLTVIVWVQAIGGDHLVFQVIVTHHTGQYGKRGVSCG